MARGTGNGPMPRGVRVGRSGHTIEIRWQYKGSTHSETLELSPTATNLKKAAAIRKQRMDGQRFGTSAPTVETSFESAAQRYLDSLRVKPSTRLSYRDALNKYWMPQLGSMAVQAIRFSHIRLIDQSTKWPSAKTRNNAIGPLRGVLAMCLHDDEIDANPAIKLRPAKRQKPEIDPFSAEEKAAILSKLDGVALAYFGLAFETGARTGELLALTWDRVSFAQGDIVIDKARVRGELTTTKTHSGRRVLLTAAAKDYLLGLDSMWRKGIVFEAQHGKPYQSAHHLNERFIAACKAAGVRYRRPYNCRHTRASLGLMAGQHAAFIARQLGHSLTMFLTTYARWIDGPRDREEMRKLESSQM